MTLQAYIVRLKLAEKRPRELVGFFVAESLENLAEMIDESLDPGACEVAEIPPGGIIWGDPGAPLVDSRIEADEEEEDERWTDFYKGCQMTEDWGQALYTEDAAFMPLVVDKII